MKRLFLIICLITASCYYPVLSHAQAGGDTATISEPIISVVYFEKEKYESLLSLPPVSFPDGAFRSVNWVYMVFEHKEKKKSKSPHTAVSNGRTSGKHMKNTFTQKPNLHSSDIFGAKAKEYSALADKTDDPTAKSGYRQLAVASHDASIAHLEQTQAMERGVAGMQLAGSIGDAVMKGLELLVDKWTRQDIEKIINWAFGPGKSIYSTAEDAPDLYLILAIEEQPQKDKYTLLQFTVEPKIMYKDELIGMTPRTINWATTSKKYRKLMEKGERINPHEMGYLAPSETTLPFFYAQELHLDGIDALNQYMLAMLLRQVAHDYQNLIEVLEE